MQGDPNSPGQYTQEVIDNLSLTSENCYSVLAYINPQVQPPQDDLAPLWQNLEFEP
jgi:hypothetical protein